MASWLAVWLSGNREYINVYIFSSGNALVSMKEVTRRRARLVLGWVTVSGIQLPVQKNLSQYI